MVTLVSWSHFNVRDMKTENLKSLGPRVTEVQIGPSAITSICHLIVHYLDQMVALFTLK